MSEFADTGFLRGVITLIVFIAFIGVVFWAWSSRRRKDFEAAARLPLEEDRPATSEQNGDSK